MHSIFNIFQKTKQKRHKIKSNKEVCYLKKNNSTHNQCLWHALLQVTEWYHCVTSRIFKLRHYYDTHGFYFRTWNILGKMYILLYCWNNKLLPKLYFKDYRMKSGNISLCLSYLNNSMGVSGFQLCYTFLLIMYSTSWENQRKYIDVENISWILFYSSLSIPMINTLKNLTYKNTVPPWQQHNFLCHSL